MSGFGGVGMLDAFNWPLTALSGLFLFLRIHLKRRQGHGLWWDDHILILAWVTLLVQSVLWTVIVQMGYGKDPRSLSPNTITTIGRILDVGSSLLILASVWSKTSFAVTLLRLPMGWLKIFVWYIIVSVMLIVGATALFVWIACGGPNTPLGVQFCLGQGFLIPYAMFAGAYAGLIDITLAMLPWKFLWGLQMRTSEKIGVALAMSMGVFAGIAAFAKTTRYPLLGEGDPSAGNQIIIWGVVETAVAIMAASLPILRALSKRQGQGALPFGDSGYSGATSSEGGSLDLKTQATVHSAVDATRTQVRSPRDSGAFTLNAKAASKLGIKTGKWGADRVQYEMTTYGREVRPVEMV